jgi:hypothetical protein
MSTLRQEVVASVGSQNPALQLRAAVEKRIDDGESREALRAELESLRKDLSNAEEDVVLEVLDFLDGWCGPSVRL